MKSLIEIQAEVDKRAALVGAVDHPSLPTYGQTEDFARPHIEVDSRGYHLVIVERGQEQSRFTTRDLDELLYRVFEGLTSELAFGHELKHRVEGTDSRRAAFKRQVELLTQLSPVWAARASTMQKEVLSKRPFDDLGGVRAKLARELREAGHSPETAWQMACERYPVPEVESHAQNQRDP